MNDQVSSVNSPSSLPDDAQHILVVDDDQRIRDLISRFLNENGYRVTAAEDAAMARVKLGGFSFDLIILDVMMPGETGFAFAEDLRRTSQVPILMLTARTEPEDRIAGLEIGVDDYLAKPFEPRELLLRMKNIIDRRVEVAKGPDEVAFGPFKFFPVRGELRMDGEPVKLTEIERNLLRHFALHPGAAVEREELARLSGHDSERAVDVQINRLRRKIETDPANPAYLQTVRGRGYIFYMD
ncbi:MAG: response regulator [Hyphomicrobiales bacterium]|nr:response regulator [Hyphomicrobiales bacterium]